jgi:Domain of unknown function (DUF4145)
VWVVQANLKNSFMINPSSWISIQTWDSRSFICGHCGNDVSSEKLYNNTSTSPNSRIYICHKCWKPNFFDKFGEQTPWSNFWNEVKDITDAWVLGLYNEARNCMKQNAYTSAVLSCRKLLMHITVSKWASAWLRFIEYVEYLSLNNYIPPWAKDWVDHIREKWNEANHEIKIMRKDEAEDLISFSEMLLKLIYEFPANIQKKRTPTQTTP